MCQRTFNFPRLAAAVVFCLLMALFCSCEKSTDGPLSATDNSAKFEGEGYFLSAKLDSGAAIHLADDTLYLQMGKIWSFNNCSLKEIQLNFIREDSVLWIAPVIKIKSNGDDCSAPYYRPDTLLKLNLADRLKDDVSRLKVKNDTDSLLDSIMVRRGTFRRDTFEIYLDSVFNDVKHYPVRTSDKGRSSVKPTIMRMLDSLTPRVFYWRTMESTCTHRVDMCKSVIPDTLYPTNWNINDTNLVPVHYACADSDSVYCINSKWENDSTALGKLQERPDTIWHYSTYYMEKVDKCGTYNDFFVRNYFVGSKVYVARELMIPAESEIHCGPSSTEDWMIYDMSNWKLVTNTDSTALVDTIFAHWDKAEVAPESLIVKE